MPEGTTTLNDRYRLIHTIGTGATSIVLFAHDLFLERPVAIKMPRKNLLSENPEYKRMFIKEAKYQASFVHPAILPLYDCYESSEGPVLIMRYAQDSLRTLISQRNLSIDSLVDAAQQVADALDYCAERGVAHRDVKPENILFDNLRYAYLADFGLAAHLDDDEKWKNVMGTPPFVSPEMLFEHKLSPTSSHRAKADQFSFGVVLYEIITGHLPFESRSTHKYPQGWEYCTALRLWKGETRPPCYEYDPQLPHGSDEVIMRMLSIDPDERYPSTKEAAKTFAEALKGRSQSAIRVFVSFSHEDINLVRELVLQLEKQGFRVWWDSELSNAGDWDDQIENAMLSSQILVLVLSPYSVKSSESKREWKYWLDHIKKPIIPVLIADCIPPYRLSSLQCIQAVGRPSAVIASEIGEAIRKTMAKVMNKSGDIPKEKSVADDIDKSLATKIGNVVLETMDLQSHSLGDDVSTKVPPKYKVSQDEIKRCLETQLLL